MLRYISIGVSVWNMKSVITGYDIIIIIFKVTIRVIMVVINKNNFWFSGHVMVYSVILI